MSFVVDSMLVFIESGIRYMQFPRNCNHKSPIARVHLEVGVRLVLDVMILSDRRSCVLLEIGCQSKSLSPGRFLVFAMTRKASKSDLLMDPSVTSTNKWRYVVERLIFLIEPRIDPLSHVMSS